MTIYHLSVKIVSCAKGRSAIDAQSCATQREELWNTAELAETQVDRRTRVRDRATGGIFGGSGLHPPTG